jgi:hypothetical protein
MAANPPDPSPWLYRGSDALAFAALDLVDRGVVGTRTRLSDALEHYADERFRVVDGSGIEKLRVWAKESCGH